MAVTFEEIKKKPITFESIKSSKTEEEEKPQTQLEKDFPGMSGSEIIETGGKGYPKEEKKGITFESIKKEKKGFFEEKLPITSKQIKYIWEEPLGLSDENKEKLKFIYGDQNTLLGKFNSFVLDNTSIGIDTVLRAGNTLGFAASGVAGDALNFIYKTLDKEPGGAGERLTRDINIALIDIMGRSGTGFNNVPKKSNTIKSIKTGEEITDIIEYANKTPENKIEVKNNINKIVNDELVEIKKNDVIIGEKLDTTNILEKNKIINDIISPEKVETPKTEFKVGDVIIIDNKGTTAKITKKGFFNKADVEKGQYFVETIDGKKGKITLEKLKEFNKQKEKISEQPKTIDTPETLKNRTPALPVDTVNKFVDASLQFLKEEQIKFIPEKNIPISKQISTKMQEVFLSDTYNTPYVIRRIAEDNKLPPKDFLDFIFPSVSQSAKEMAAWSRASRYLRNQLDPTGQILQSTGSPTFNVLKRLDDIRRGLLVTRIATAVRNYASQTARITLDSLQNITDFALQQAVKPFVDPVKFQKNQVSPFTSLNQLITNFRQWKPSEFKKVKKQTDLILDQFPNEKNRLFLRYGSDIAVSVKGTKKSKVDKFFDTAQDGVDILNFLNKTQEYITRRAVVLARLDELIRANPKYYNKKNLQQILRDGEHSKIRVSDLGNAVDKALEVTFAKEFNMYKKGASYENFAAGVINTINKLPFVLTSIIPFPRFLFNSLRFHAEFSPFGFLRFLSKADRQKIAKGDTSGLSRALLGTGLLFAAMALRKQDYAGEKWYEFKVGDRTIDTRPYNPLAAYLFVGDVINRYMSGTLRDIDLKDIITVFAGVRGTTGLYLFDQIADFVANTNVKAGKEKVLGTVKKFIGELLAGYLTPLQNITDLMAQYYPEMRISRDTSQEPFKGAFKKRILDTDLPEATSPTNFIIDKNGKIKAAPYVKESPLVGQFTGVRFITPKNAAEKEFDKLQIKPGEIYRSTGIPELDRAYKDIYSYYVGKGISNFVQGKYYNSLSFNQKILVIKKMLNAAKNQTKKQLQQNEELAPYLLQYNFNNLSKEKRKIINDSIGIDYINSLIEGLKEK